MFFFDLVLAGNDVDKLVAAVLSAIDHITSWGGRLNIDKCEFFVSRFDWCGIEVDLPTNQWRIAQGRVSSLVDTPIPTDKDALGHVLGIMRYYFFGVPNQRRQRELIAKLAELLKVRGLDTAERFAAAWTPGHTAAMREALAAITAGSWLLVYDPSQPVTVTTDAAGSYGYSVTANQWDPLTGEMRAIAYISRGWLSTQLKWKPQAKESYAQMTAVSKIMPQYFPYANVTLLCDNKNLSSAAESDIRIVRWQNEIRDSGCAVRYWVPGKWNTIADYGSRSVMPSPEATLSEEEQHELHIYAVMVDSAGVRARSSLVAAAGAGASGDTALPVVAGGHVDDAPAVTVVPGHLPMTSMVYKIARAQMDAPVSEREGWSGANYSTAVLAGVTLTAAIAVWLWAYSPLAVLFTLTGVYGAAGIYLYRRLTELLANWQTLSASLEEIRKDRACLEKILA